MSQDNALRDRIASAWNLHRNAQHEQAVEAFQAITANTQDDVDAFYGLGLALRAAGQTDQAADAFRKGYDLALVKLQLVRDEAETATEHHVAENLGITEEDRYMMITRMLHQRLAEHGIDVPAILEVF